MNTTHSTSPLSGKKRTGAYATDEQRWQAVLRKDRQADGKFCYSVRTTGVYCRPSCPSRPALRKNVAFHASAAEAEAAGFRPCRRCDPAGPGLAERHAAAVKKACAIIESAAEPPALDQIARAAGLSASHFHRIFKAATGVTPRAYAQARRTQRMREELPRGRTVTAAIYAAGFNSSGRFYAESAGMLGMTPTAFRRGGTGESLHFAVGQCSLGSILVAASDKGVCAIALGDDPAALVRDLQDAFPHAHLSGGNRVFEQWVARVIGLVEAPRLGLDLPLDIRGTAFQQRVWQALRQIPPGTTLSYTAVARRLGIPKAVRAVASACAANTIALAIPCHRVVRTDGTLSGYRWGVARKRALLERERAGPAAG